MFSGEIYYTDPLTQLTKSLVKHRFSLHNLQIIAVMYSRNIPMAKSELTVFKAKKSENMLKCLISNNYYIHLKIYFEIFVTYNF